MGRRNACGFIETPVRGREVVWFDRAKPDLNLNEHLFRHSLILIFDFDVSGLMEMSNIRAHLPEV